MPIQYSDIYKSSLASAHSMKYLQLVSVYLGSHFSLTRPNPSYHREWLIIQQSLRFVGEYIVCVRHNCPICS